MVAFTWRVAPTSGGIKLKRTSLSDAPNLFGEELCAEATLQQGLSQADPYAGLKWSFSKRGVLNQCPRRFYFQYYGGNVRQAKNDAAKERLRRLKQLVTREERTGQLLHRAIATYFRKVQQGENIISDSLIGWTVNIFKEDIEFSQQRLERAELSTSAKAPHFLMEYASEYASEANPDELCSEAAQDMVDNLERFLVSPVFAAVREMGVVAETMIEKRFTRLACVPFGVEGQVDFAHISDQGHVTIVDWKSGADMGEGDESLQLAVYALWAREKFGCEPDTLTIQKSFLGSDDLVTYPLTDRKLASARLAILQDAESFVRMHSYGADGAVEAFTPCVQEAVCRRCPFVTVCREGKEGLS